MRNRLFGSASTMPSAASSVRRLLRSEHGCVRRRVVAAVDTSTEQDVFAGTTVGHATQIECEHSSSITARKRKVHWVVGVESLVAIAVDYRGENKNATGRECHDNNFCFGKKIPRIKQSVNDTLNRKAAVRFRTALNHMRTC